MFIKKNSPEVDLFVEKISAALKEQNMTVVDFSRSIGVSRAVVYQWLNRKSVMGLDKYFLIKKLLGISV